MTTSNFVTPQRVALVLAAMLWAVGSAYLVQTEIRRVDPDWVVVVATPLVWAVVIALPILAHHALREGRLVAAGLLTIAALVGSAYTLNGTIGRQAEKTETAVLEASASGEGRKLLEDELKRTRTSLEVAKRETAAACKKSWTDNCQGLERREKAYQARLDQLIAALGDAPAAKPIASGNRRVVSALVLLSGRPAEQVEPWVGTFSDALLGLLLEIGALALGFYGSAPSRDRAERALPKGGTTNGGKLDEMRPLLPAPDVMPVMASATTAEPVVIDEDTAAVLKALKGRTEPMTNDEMRKAMRIKSKGEASRRVSNAVASGLVVREEDPVNRSRVRIRLASTAIN